MNETKHTPGPWRVGDAGATVFGPKKPDGSLPEIIASRLKGDNARFIVRAVNCHDELLEALRNIANDSRFWQLDSSYQEQARAAIAKAEGGAE